MIQFLGYLNLIQLVLLSIAIITIVVLANILKKRKSKIIMLENRKIAEQRAFFRRLETESKRYEKEIKNAASINDFKRIYNELSHPFSSNSD